ncbi:MAG: hypothetical protein J3Q66DRAFT_353223 [Benniella sp.]|nr:MAG: hypothetical protein J3Q66DRAFT_353223 [Benniella sp.]
MAGRALLSLLTFAAVAIQTCVAHFVLLKHSRGGYLVYDPIVDAVGVRFSEDGAQIWDVPLIDTDPPNHHIRHVPTGKYLAPNTNVSDSGNRVILSDAPYGWIPWFSSYGVRMSTDDKGDLFLDRPEPQPPQSSFVKATLQNQTELEEKYWLRILVQSRRQSRLRSKTPFYNPRKL